jgi:O-antigen ligase
VPFFSKTKQFISKKSIQIFIGILSIITLLITFSLSGLILIGLLLISIIILEKISIKRFLMPIMILVVVLISSDMFLKNYTQISILDLFSQRVSGLLFTQKTGMGMTTGESAPQRVSSIINAWNLFIESPIVGIGVGNTYYHPKSEQRYADSSFFHVLSETGIIGLFFFVLLFVNIFRISIFLRKYRYRFIKKFPELSTMQSYILYWVIISAFQHVFLGNAVGNAGFWISLGLIFGTYNSTMRELVENKETNLEP